MITPVAFSLVPPRAPQLSQQASRLDSVQLSTAATAAAPDTGLSFRVIQVRDSSMNPVGEPVDLTLLTPKTVRAMPSEDRRVFFERLSYQGSVGNQHVFDDARGSQTNVMRLDEATLLHLYRQDPSLAGVMLETNPELVAGLYGALTAGALSSGQLEEANEFACAVLSSLPAGLDEGQSQALATLTRQTLRANGQDPAAVGMLLEAADAGVRSDFNAGVVAGSLLAGVRDSGEAPLEFLDKLPGRFTPAGMVTSLLCKAASRANDTRDVARANYLSLYDRVVEGLEAAGNLEQYQGFVKAGRWNA